MPYQSPTRLAQYDLLPFTRDEGDRIVAHLASHYPGPVANLVEFWMWTGLRTSELYGLTWANVDLACGSVLISESVVQGVRKERTKTSVTRIVILNSRALAALERQRAHTQLVGGPVFQDTRYGTPWRDERAFRRSYWTPTLKLLGIRYHRPYNLRHTYATIILMAGMTSAFSAKQLGHSIEMFHSTYSKWLDGEQNDLEMQLLEQAIVRIPPQNLPGEEVITTFASDNREINGVADGIRTHNSWNHNPGLYH
jgi:integrase